MPGDARITVRLPRVVVDRLDAMASERKCSRARILELLVEGDEPRVSAPTSERALQLLAESAEAGSVTARVALVRTLSGGLQMDAVQREIDELARRRMERRA